LNQGSESQMTTLHHSLAAKLSAAQGAFAPSSPPRKPKSRRLASPHPRRVFSPPSYSPKGCSVTRLYDAQSWQAAWPQCQQTPSPAKERLSASCSSHLQHCQRCGRASDFGSDPDNEIDIATDSVSVPSAAASLVVVSAGALRAVLVVHMMLLWELKKAIRCDLA
jgi:hypothetical protein